MVQRTDALILQLQREAEVGPDPRLCRRATTSGRPVREVAEVLGDDLLAGAAGVLAGW